MILICIFLFVGCASNEEAFLNGTSNSMKNENNTASKQNAYVNATNNSTENEKDTETKIDSYYIYGIHAQNNTFDKEISENQIDKDYKKAINQATTTLEMVKVEQAYIDKWKDEMQVSIDLFKTFLSETDYNFFVNGQQEWEKQLIDTTKSDYNIILNKEYGISLGSGFQLTWLSYMRYEYRERVIHIKFLIYLMQNKY